MHVLRCIALTFALTSVATAAPEPWSDGRLSPRNGLVLWLDAAKLNAARTAQQLPELGDAAPVDHWPDASGFHRDLSQFVDESRPLLRVTSAGAFVSFDGRDDFLVASNLRTTTQEATVFVVAAPRSNPGNFRAFASANAIGVNDYTSGFNLDLGARATEKFDVLNAEGAGMSGERDLLQRTSRFGSFHIIAMQLGTGKGSGRLFFDAARQESRDRAAAPIRMDQFTVGARCCSNEGKAPFVQGFLNGDIAEIIIFDRLLADGERDEVGKYLATKHAALLIENPPATAGKPLVPVTNPPLVQMLVPGFTVRELPVSLTNIDCLRYRSDGRLVAGAYNGKIWLLGDVDGDGLEEKAELFWQSDDLKNVIGMAVTPPGDPRGEGVFVATAGRILFIRDKDHDGRGDEQVVVASGWEKQGAPGGGGSVDALGLTLGADGSLYFALGTSAYNNAYLIDKDGHAHYRLDSERGTILRISPDFSKREIVCTGIRYPFGAAFNRLGDLFVTEQEGATWLPNGNPFDELLHIQAGRHYGFPPRHPRHLPEVIDEPSTFDFAPQHQSTCGLAFNEASKEGRIFGPAWWIDDAFIAGESRGKLWRTKLARTAAGYVAQTSLVACLSMLTVDVALSPAGDLVVACHSGKPDWGTGPEGAGKLFKISRETNEIPRPVLAWSSAPDQIRVTFDHALDLARVKNLQKQIEITHGRYVAAGDRFESIRPGYQAVKDQLAAPRYDVPVLGVTLSPDRQTLVLATPPLSAADNYAIDLPDVAGTSAGGKALPQVARIDVATNLSGLEARWHGADGSETQTIWLPHLDLDVARQFTVGSSEHAHLWDLMKKPGSLTLRGKLDLWQMLHPAVQPGAQLDYEPSVEKVRVEISREPPAAGFPMIIERAAREGEWADFRVEIPTGRDEAKLHITWTTADDPRARPFPLRRFLLPWATSSHEPAPLERNFPELAGGNWLRGRKLYFGKATCHVCHGINGEGGVVGPDLSNLIYRDLSSVIRDIREPGAALNPDHLAYQIALRDGNEFVAVVLAEERGTLRVGDASGVVKEIARANVRALTPLTTSLMPPALLDALTPAEQRDLLTFLLTPALAPAPIDAPNAPPARTRAEVNPLLPNESAPIDHPKPLRILLAFGEKDHGPGEHDYPLWADRWSKLLALAENVTTRAHKGWPTAEQFANSDVIIFYSNNPDWNAERKPELDDFIQRGGGAVFVHWAVEGHESAPALADCIGLASDSRTTKYRHGDLQLSFSPAAHPVTRGFGPLRFVDESYWQLVGDPQRVTILATQIEEGAPRPLLWTTERGAGRVFASIPGHYTWTFDDPLFRLLLLRGICWSAKEPVDRLSDLATIGARIDD